jgi:hypothetical protein
VISSPVKLFLEYRGERSCPDFVPIGLDCAHKLAQQFCCWELATLVVRRHIGSSWGDGYGN